MKKVFLILIFLFLQSCSGLSIPRITPKKTGIDKEFEPYIQEYRNIIGRDKHSDKFNRLHINFADLEGSIIGRCWWALNGEYEIEIDRDYWYRMFYSSIDKQFTVYHELEHCIRYRMHSNRKEEIENIVDFFEEVGFKIGFFSKPGYLDDGCPASVMHSHSFSWECQNKHYNYYIEDIRNWGN